MARIMVVSKDNGDTKMLLPIAIEADRRKHKLRIFAEGMGSLQYDAACIKPYFKDEPKPDPKTEFDWDDVFCDFNPQAVLVGFPGPNHLSRAVALAANERHVPVVGVEDYWGGVKREPDIKYAMVLTIDDYAVEIVRGCVLPDVPVYVIGNHAVPGADYRSPDAVLEGMKEIRSRFAEIFVFIGGGGKHTTEELKLLVASLELTTGNWCLIPRYHPNIKKQMATEIGENRLFVDVWDEILLPLGDRVMRLDAGNSDDMAVVCDACFSGAGSSMNTAISCGKPTIAVTTEATKKAFLEARLDHVPAVYLGGAKVLAEVQNLRPLLVRPHKSIQEKFRPLDAGLAVRKIESWVLKK